MFTYIIDFFALYNHGHLFVFVSSLKQHWQEQQTKYIELQKNCLEISVDKMQIFFRWSFFGQAKLATKSKWKVAVKGKLSLPFMVQSEDGLLSTATSHTHNTYLSLSRSHWHRCLRKKFKSKWKRGCSAGGHMYHYTKPWYVHEGGKTVHKNTSRGVLFLSVFFFLSLSILSSQKKKKDG